MKNQGYTTASKIDSLFKNIQSKIAMTANRNQTLRNGVGDQEKGKAKGQGDVRLEMVKINYMHSPVFQSEHQYLSYKHALIKS